MIEVRECRTFEELDACVELQREAFGYSDLEIIPRRYLLLSRRAGGWTLGAFNAERLVGFVHHLVAVRGAHEVIGYSHMMAVAQAYQNRGVGALLKWAQRERAVSEGRSYITWTWNPMQARNAHFNLNRLGVTASSYGANFYGTEGSFQQSDEQTGIDSDRLFTDWDLHSPRVVALALGNAAPSLPDPAETIEIPADWSALLRQDASAARREQERVRAEFQKAFAAGLICAGFRRDAEHPHYLLYRTT
ncbi:MAG TPA: GNAT family N-acetyltransferase [Pyrinomonadaceae bacterium]|jgi:predicted GNAT superfamily acetyltransferase